MIIFFTATTDFANSLNVSFDESTYSIDEDDEQVTPMLILSSESLKNITVYVKSQDDTAIGKYRRMFLYCIKTLAVKKLGKFSKLQPSSQSFPQ